MTNIQDDLGDFRNFIFLAHKFIGLEPPTELQYAMADNQQNSTSREAIQAFRGCGKSHLSALFAIYTLYHHPNAKILIVSATKKRAAEFVKFCKDVIIACPHLCHMIGMDGDRNLSYSFDVANTLPSQTPSLEAKGIESQITGSRSDYVICDDLEISVNSMSADAREKLMGLATEFEAVLLPDGAVDSKIIYLGTPHSSSSIYNALPDKGYILHKYPAYDSDGEPTEPTRFPRKILEKRRRGMGDSSFMLQYQLDTSMADADKFPLKVSDLMVQETLDPNYCYEVYNRTQNQIQMYVKESKANDKAYWCSRKGQKVEYTKKILALDPAGSGKDDFSYCVLGTRNSFVFVLEQGHWSGFAGSRIQDIKSLAEKYNINEIVVETNFGDDLIIHLLQPNINVPITSVKHHTQKEKRIINILEPVLNQHKLVVGKEFLTNKGIGQFTNLTPTRGSLKHDDYVDCLAMGVHHLREEMTVNVAQAMRKQYEETVDKEFQAIMNDGSGGVPNYNWTSL